MPKRSSVYTVKTIISGDIIEIYEYDKSILQDFKNGSQGRKNKADEENAITNRKQSIYRAKQNAKRLINTNYKKGSFKLLTITFKDNVQSPEYASKELKKYIMRLNYYLGYQVEYIAFREIQDGSRKLNHEEEGRGAIHFHIPLFNVPQYMNLNELRKLWKHGSTNLKKDKGDIQDLGGYLTNYMDMTPETFKGHRLYTTSRNLKKPIEIKEKDVQTSYQFVNTHIINYTNTYNITNKDGNVINTVKYTKYIK